MDSEGNQSKRRHIIILGVLSFLVVGILIGLVVYFFTRTDKMKPIAKFVRPKQLPKYFAIDVDGTFYIKEKEKMQKNIDAFKLLIENQITPFFCTGRDFCSIQKMLGRNFFAETEYNGFPGIYLNGALVYDKEGKLLHISKFSEEFLRTFYEHVEKNKMRDKVVFFTDEDSFCLDLLYAPAVEYITSEKLFLPKITNFEILVKKNVTSITFPCEECIIPGLKENFDYMVKYSDGIIAHLTPPKCNKKSALEILLAYLESNEDECAFIGDGENDIEAMDFCKLSFAVGNASDEVKRWADWIVDATCEEGGFERAVHALCG